VSNPKKILLFFTFFFTLLSYSQERIPLRAYLEGLENKYSCNFSFKDSDLSFHFIQPKEFPTLNEALSYLSDSTLFNFTLIDANTVAISEKGNLITVCGEIFNGSNNQKFAEVAIITPYEQLISDKDGHFSLRLSSVDDEIYFQYIGYNNLRLKGSRFQIFPCQKVFLSRKIELLSTITLSNYLAKGISKNLDGSLTVNYQEFDILPGLIEPDVLLTVQALPGIQSVNETVSYLNIRGGTNDQNLILWDGIKMYQNGHFFGLISAFNPQLTSKLTLIKNGTSAVYGDGVSGVLSMEGSEKINQQLRIGAGLNLLSSDAFADIPMGHIGSIQVAGRKSINGLIATPTYNAYFDKAFQNTEVTSMGETFSTSDDSFNFYDASIRALIHPNEKDRFRANFLYLGNKLEFLENALIDDTAQSLQSDLIQDNISGGFYYQRLWSDYFNTEIQLYGNSYLLEATNYDIINNQRLIQQNKLLESGIKIHGNYQVSDNLKTIAGYQLNETGITNFEEINNPFFQRTDKQVLLSHSFFAETQFRPFENTLLNAGLRVNHIGKFNEWLVEPRVSFNHRFLKYFTFELLGEIKSQTTTQIIDFQNDFLGVENRRWVLSKPDEIPILKSEQLSAGIAINRKGWLISIEPYIKKVKGITTQSQGFQNQFQNVKTHGDYMAKGIDFLVNKRFKQINTWLSYSYANNDYTFDSLEPMDFSNNLDIRHTFTYGLDYSFHRFNISAGVNWHTGKPTTLLVEGEEIRNGELNFNTPNSANIDDYVRVDVSGTYKFSLGDSTKMFVGASIWNLLDQQNVINHFFRLDNNGEVEQIDEYALRFTPNVSVRLLF
jgi:TonB-dependent Receptor Plug Domain